MKDSFLLFLVLIFVVNLALGTRYLFQVGDAYGIMVALHFFVSGFLVPIFLETHRLMKKHGRQ